MLNKSPDFIYRSTLFNSISGLIHGYSGRQIGDMRKGGVRKQFLRKLNLQENLTVGQQIHGNRVKTLRVGDLGKVIIGADALVGKGEPPVPILGVRTADCVPILAVDPEHKIIGTAHSGWRGTYDNIAVKLIAAMKKSGADPKKVYISLGPHIGRCCYNIDESRAAMFSKAFGPDFLAYEGKYIYLDLGRLIRKQLLLSGVLPAQIDDELLCTSCNNLYFFSYRKDDKRSYGEMLGVISFYDGEN